jgi:hypothetical protein
MDDLVLKKLIALNWVLEKMYWLERLEETCHQLDDEIAAEHGYAYGAVRRIAVYSPGTCLVISDCS